MKRQLFANYFPSGYSELDKKILLGFMTIVFGTVMIVTLSTYYAINFGVQDIVFFSIGVAFIMTILASIVLSRFIVGPVLSLYKATQEIERGNYHTRVHIHTNDELEELGDSFNAMAKQLEHLAIERERIEQAKTKFISITSHELRSPMTPMKGQLEMLLGDYLGKLSQKQRDSLEIILRNTNHLDKIIVDFLELSRIEAARMQFEYKTVKPKGVVEDVKREMEKFASKKRIRLVNTVKPLDAIEADPDRISQVLRNLIENAIKFSKEGGKIVISARDAGKFVEFSVKDQGIGIEKKHLEKIFEPFYQEEESMYRQYGGVGLGLAIVKGVIESQGGKISVESQKGKGTTFSFTFPKKSPKQTKAILSMVSSEQGLRK